MMQVSVRRLCHCTATDSWLVDLGKSRIWLFESGFMLLPVSCRLYAVLLCMSIPMFVLL